MFISADARAFEKMDFSDGSEDEFGSSLPLHDFTGSLRGRTAAADESAFTGVETGQLA